MLMVMLEGEGLLVMEHAHAERITHAILSIAHANRAKKVRKVMLEIGVLSGIDRQVIARLVKEMLSGSIAQGAGIGTLSVPARIVCGICKYSGIPKMTLIGRDVVASCPNCKRTAIVIYGGKRVGLREIEMDFGRRGGTVKTSTAGTVATKQKKKKVVATNIKKQKPFVKSATKQKKKKTKQTTAFKKKKNKSTKHISKSRKK